MVDIEKLIQLVKKQPVIYDGSHPKYRDREELAAIWRKIALQLNYNENECRDKWHNLRSVYRRVRKKEKLKTQGSTSNSYRKWAYYDSMKFLYPYTEEGMAEANSSEKSVPSVGEGNSDFEVHSAVHELELETSIQCDPTETSTQCDPTEENVTIMTIEPQPFEAKRRKLSTSNCDNQYLAEVQTVTTEKTDDSDSDKMFLLSLLPFVKQLEPVDNLEFRVEVQQILQKKLYPPPLENVENGD